MVLYGITLVPLAKEIRSADVGLLSPFNVDNVVFDGLARRSEQFIKLLMKRGLERGYFTEQSKPLSISDTPGQEEATQREFDMEGLTLNF